jgi:hypothetical protein
METGKQKLPHPILGRELIKHSRGSTQIKQFLSKLPISFGLVTGPAVSLSEFSVLKFQF